MHSTETDRPILITGGTGQLGWELRRSLSVFGPLLYPSREELDLSDPEQILLFVEKKQPAAIVNAAAYNAVDKAESDHESAEALNIHAPRTLAEAAAKQGIVFFHYSSDYVFDGSGSEPWSENDICSPLSYYGRTKQLGEEAVLDSKALALVFRTSWVFGIHGHNFLKSILNAAMSRKELKVVADQHGTPTPAHLLADITALSLYEALSDRLAQESRLYHLAPRGEASWHSYAEYAVDYARSLEAPIQAEKILPISTEQWPTTATRPRNSRLECSKFEQTFGLRLPQWEAGVRRVTEILVKKEMHI